MINKINFRYLGYILTAMGMLLMISFAYSEVKNFQYLSIIIAILGLILTFESSRLRAFRFSEKDWIATKERDSFYLEVKKIRHLKNLPIPKVFRQLEDGTIKEIFTAIKINPEKVVKVYSNMRIKEDVIITI